MTNDLNGPIRRLNPPELGRPPGYSQIVEVQGRRIIFIAGQTALNREGELIGKNDFAAQAEQVFQNLGIALKCVGCTASNLAKLTVFLRDMDNLPVYREARNRFLRNPLLCGAKLMRELLSHVDSMFAVLLSNIGRLIKELQNGLSRAIELIDPSSRAF
jgi:enamine deaminase RidA (YjgF/YER057c/UK114 family)